MKRPQITAVEKKLLILSLPYLGDTSLQKRNKLGKSFKSRLNCRKLQVVFKSQKKLTNISRFKSYLPFVSGSGIKNIHAENAILPIIERRLSTRYLVLDNILGYQP